VSRIFSSGADSTFKGEVLKYFIRGEKKFCLRETHKRGADYLKRDCFWRLPPMPPRWAFSSGVERYYFEFDQGHMPHVSKRL
jgi:hypothetical protein